MGWGEHSEADAELRRSQGAGDALAKAVASFLSEPTTANLEALQEAQTTYRRERTWA